MLTAQNGFEIEAISISIKFIQLLWWFLLFLAAVMISNVRKFIILTCLVRQNIWFAYKGFTFNNISTFRSLQVNVTHGNSASWLVRRITPHWLFSFNTFLCIYPPYLSSNLLPLTIKAYVDLCRLSFTREKGKRKLSITRYAGGKITTPKLNHKNQDIPQLPDIGRR